MSATAIENLANQITTVWKAATGQGASDFPSLIPPNVSSLITNRIQFINPLNSMMNPTAWKGEKGYNGTTYKFPILTGYRNPGNYAGEKAEGQFSSTTIEDETINLKAKKSRFKVWNMGRRAAEGYIDPVAVQLAGEATAFGLDFALGLIYDVSETMNKDTFGGSDNGIGAWERSLWKNIQANRIDYASTTDGTPYLPVDLTPFIKLYTRSTRAGGVGHKRAWLMTPEMRALVGTLGQGNEQFMIVQELGDMPKSPNDGSGLPFEIGKGRLPTTLFNIPIMESTIMGGGLVADLAGYDVMGSISLSQSATGGSMSNSPSGGATHIKVAKVVRKLRADMDSFIGLSMASASASISLTGGGSTQKITVTFAADAEALWYAVYACTSGLDQDYKLVGWFPGKILDSDGEFSSNRTSINIGTITADTDPSSATYGIPTQGVIGKMYLDHPPMPKLGVNAEYVALIDFDDEQGFGQFRYLDESADQLYGFATLRDVTPSQRTDSFEWMLYSYGSPIGRYQRTSGLLTNLRSA